MLMKAMDARKKAEERERLKQEKKDEKRLNKERKLELRRLELEIAKELKKPNDDMCLADHKVFIMRLLRIETRRYEKRRYEKRWFSYRKDGHDS
ncbi:hypothetical protein DPEC_G00380060 [Dallia pectoralis]|nr:hypothetical protein DPEC_G00380060 [Dallia pectoralis]